MLTSSDRLIVRSDCATLDEPQGTIPAFETGRGPAGVQLGAVQKDSRWTRGCARNLQSCWTLFLTPAWFPLPLYHVFPTALPVLHSVL